MLSNRPYVTYCRSSGRAPVTLAPMTRPILIACAHGTSSTEGAAEVDALRHGIALLRPELEVRGAYVDVQDPALPNVVSDLPAGAPAVVVPLLLSVGYHVRVDIARAAGSRPETRAAAPLGPDPRLAALVDQRLQEAGVTGDDAVILAAAGSSDPAAAQNVEALAGQLRTLRPNRIVAAYGSSAKPSVPDAVAMLRGEMPGGGGTGRVVIAAYLLAPGFFHDQLAKAGADVVTAALLPSPVLAEIALERYDAALAS